MMPTSPSYILVFKHKNNLFLLYCSTEKSSLPSLSLSTTPPSPTRTSNFSVSRQKRAKSYLSKDTATDFQKSNSSLHHHTHTQKSKILSFTSTHFNLHKDGGRGTPFPTIIRDLDRLHGDVLLVSDQQK